MKIYDLANRVEEISVALENVVGLGYAVYEALFRGVWNPDTYEGAAFIMIQEILRISDNAKNLVEELYAEAKK